MRFRSQSVRQTLMRNDDDDDVDNDDSFINDDDVLPRIPMIMMSG